MPIKNEEILVIINKSDGRITSKDRVEHSVQHWSGGRSHVRQKQHGGDWLRTIGE